MNGSEERRRLRERGDGKGMKMKKNSMCEERGERGEGRGERGQVMQKV